METNPGLGRAVLVFLVKDDQVLLALKKKKIGAGLLNGYGGGIEPNETSIEAAIREVGQEAGVNLDKVDLEGRGVINFHKPKPDGIFVCEVHIFVATYWQGTPQESDEMGEPRWFPINNLPFGDMMPGDELWMSYVLNHDRPLEGNIWYDLDHKTVMNHVLFIST